MNITDTLATAILTGKAKKGEIVNGQQVMEIPMSDGNDIVFTVNIGNSNNRQYCARKNDIPCEYGDVWFLKFTTSAHCLPSTGTFLQDVLQHAQNNTNETQTQNRCHDIEKQFTKALNDLCS